MDLGRAEISPSVVQAGDSVELVFRYVVGHPIDDTGCLKLTMRYAGDYARPQFKDPTAPDYWSVETSGDCRIEPRWDPKGHTRPWGAALYLKITGGFLDRGETITVRLGDRRQGSPGWRMQTFCERAFRFRTYVDPIATWQFKELPESPQIKIIAGPPADAVCIAPSRVQTGTPFFYHLKLLDAWGNPVRPPSRRRHPGFSQPGVQRLTATDRRTGLSAQSNPIDVLNTLPALHPWWGDLHGQSNETIGTNRIDDYFRFARNVGLVDVCAHQGNDFQITDAFWQRVIKTAERFNQPGRFVTFPGYEWSGNTPLGGDRNVYFVDPATAPIFRSGRDLIGGRSRYPDAPTADELFRLLRESGANAFVYAHVGGRYADLSQHDSALEVAVEIHSAWGTFEWLAHDAFRRGYRLGICANSDGHKCRPGASYPGAGRFGALGGLTCFLAESLDRQAIAAAIRARHFYATTGHRPLMQVTTAAAIMGDILLPAPAMPVVHVKYSGTAAVESASLWNGGRCLAEHRPSGRRSGRRIKLSWSGAEVRGRARMVDWAGGLQVRGNRIVHVQPVNFWNPRRGMQQKNEHEIVWQSVTTGGTAGVILVLAQTGGQVNMVTKQGDFSFSPAELEAGPRSLDLGGLGKEIRAELLPDPDAAHWELDLDFPAVALAAGENPLYVRVLQEDGHQAWSSPIYAVAAEK